MHRNIDESKEKADEDSMSTGSQLSAFRFWLGAVDLEEENLSLSDAVEQFL